MWQAWSDDQVACARYPHVWEICVHPRQRTVYLKDVEPRHVSIALRLVSGLSADDILSIGAVREEKGVCAADFMKRVVCVCRATTLDLEKSDFRTMEALANALRAYDRRDITVEVQDNPKWLVPFDGLPVNMAINVRSELDSWTVERVLLSARVCNLPCVTLTGDFWMYDTYATPEFIHTLAIRVKKYCYDTVYFFLLRCLSLQSLAINIVSSSINLFPGLLLPVRSDCLTSLELTSAPGSTCHSLVDFTKYSALRRLVLKNMEIPVTLEDTQMEELVVHSNGRPLLLPARMPALKHLSLKKVYDVNCLPACPSAEVLELEAVHCDAVHCDLFASPNLQHLTVLDVPCLETIPDLDHTQLHTLSVTSVPNLRAFDFAVPTTLQHFTVSVSTASSNTHTMSLNIDCLAAAKLVEVHVTRIPLTTEHLETALRSSIQTLKKLTVGVSTELLDLSFLCREDASIGVVEVHNVHGLTMENIWRARHLYKLQVGMLHQIHFSGMEQSRSLRSVMINTVYLWKDVEIIRERVLKLEWVFSRNGRLWEMAESLLLTMLWCNRQSRLRLPREVWLYMIDRTV